MKITTTEVSCCKCGFAFWVPAAFQEIREKDHEAFYCPACGVSLYYAEKTDMERCSENVAALKWNVKTLRDENVTLERRRASQQGATTKLRRKLATIRPEE